MTIVNRITPGFMTGALLGLSLGLLIAPAKGNKFRAAIGERATSLGQRLNRLKGQRTKNKIEDLGEHFWI
jgi:gas vesicle protein